MGSTGENTGQTIPMTEAECAAIAEWRMRAMLDKLNQCLVGYMPEGVQFVWMSGPEA